MANATPNRFGANNGGADKDALFMMKFAGEVMAEFEQATAALDKHMIRTITDGKSASFPKLGKTTAGYHTPGTEIVGKQIGSSEVVITIDDLLLTDVFIANIDEAKAHYDVRQHYAKEMGQALALQFDKHVLQTGIKAALTATPTLTDGPIGAVFTNADLGAGKDMDESPDDLVDAIFKAAQHMDENNIPESERYVFLKPKHYYKLANSSKVQNVEFGNTGNGSAAKGKILEVAGIRIVKTNQLPATNITAGTVEAGTSNRHLVDARNTVGLVMHPSAVGTVKLLDLATESDYDIRRQGTLMVAKYAMGHGVVRPESSVLLRTAAPA